MNWIIAHIPDWNSLLALILFWLPMALCAYGYTIEFVKKYRAELAAREKAREPDHYYNPSLTLGWIVGHVFITAMPVANLVAAVFSIAPKVFSDLFDWFGRVLDVPLVPKERD